MNALSMSGGVIVIHMLYVHSFRKQDIKTCDVIRLPSLENKDNDQSRLKE